MSGTWASGSDSDSVDGDDLGVQLNTMENIFKFGQSLLCNRCELRHAAGLVGRTYNVKIVAFLRLTRALRTEGAFHSNSGDWVKMFSCFLDSVRNYRTNNDASGVYTTSKIYNLAATASCKMRPGSLEQSRLG